MSSTVRHPLPGRPVRVVATALGAAALVVLVPGSAQAHVGMTADSTAAGSHALLTLAVPHGCEGSPTTRISVQVPAGIDDVVPAVNPGWQVRKVEEKLDPPVTADDGDQITSRVAEVVWTARRPLPDGFRDSLSLQVALPAEAAGQQLAFPTLQTCVEGETAWTQVPAAGQDHDDLDHPAPVVLVTAAEPDDHGAAGGSGDHHAGAADADLSTGSGAGAEVTAARPTGTSWTGPAGLALGALGLAAGSAALWSSRRAPARAPRS
ncbi:YcnI family copper-binding membrane protein [Microlunatus flavus]|uniref:Uncharacterized protein YcnI n=1 Tax=Microlunatus flavus TaxID=1036181 RepID=A0A1H9J7I8_9ACTN|nr:YcnI family protein [Microlunatus flavus]SEQ82763.1 Uncharacterized protein YcnI [Microlunatus flavus]